MLLLRLLLLLVLALLRLARLARCRVNCLSAAQGIWAGKWAGYILGRSVVQSIGASLLRYAV